MLARALVWTALLGFAAVCGADAGTAKAAGPLETGLIETAFAGPDAPLAFSRAHDAGATVVRLSLNWRSVAPFGLEAPDGFDPSNHNDPHYRWKTFDREVQLAVEHGLTPLAVVSDTPIWAKQVPRYPRRNYKPKPVELGRFAEAAARRYSGEVAGLPRVGLWEVWNEPNLRQFLRPQFDDGPRFVGPKIYRRLVNSFAAAVKRVHSDNVVVAGGLAPFSSPGPLRFMRELLRRRVRFDVWSHHPYTSGGPSQRARNPDNVSIGDLSQMRRLLKSRERAGRVVSDERVRFWVTEFSWDTKPPDPYAVPERLHARWVAEALYRMWRSGVSLVTWYLLRDADPGNRTLSSGTAESGLYFRSAEGLASDRPKLALQAFRFPFVALPSRRGARIWGRTPGGVAAQIVLEGRSGGRWREILRLNTNRYGIFRRLLRGRRRGVLRARIPGQLASLPFTVRRTRNLRVNAFGGPVRKPG